MFCRFSLMVAALLAGAAVARVAAQDVPDPHGIGPVAEAGPTPDAVPAAPEKGPFLFCYFLGNGDGLHLASSTDGLKFTPLNGDQPYMKPTLGGKLMRDPCLRQGPDGMYHLVWTTGWWDKGFGTSSSPDLLHWSPQLYVEVEKNEPTAVNTWAPELFYDDVKQQWLIFWATTIPEKYKETLPASGADMGGEAKNIPLNHRIYYTTTRDFKAFADTKLLLDPGFNCIDATMTKMPNGKYMMVFKDETVVPVPQKNLHTVTADSPEGPWSKPSASISPDKLWVEGPTIDRVGDTWYVFYDVYRDHKYGAIKTDDFVKWEEVKSNFAFPAGARHGTVFPVTQATLERLKTAPPQ